MIINPVPFIHDTFFDVPDLQIQISAQSMEILKVFLYDVIDSPRVYIVALVLIVHYGIIVSA